MIESITYRGVWALPENTEDYGVPGTLTFDPQEGIVLELMGSLIESDIKDSLHAPIIIIGFTNDGKKITLYQCFQFNRSVSMLGGIETGKYSATFMFEGAHFENESDLKFNSIKGKIDKLDEWVRKYGFTKVASNRNKKTIEVAFELPKPIGFDLKPDLSGEIGFIYFAPILSNTTKVTIEQSSQVVLTAKNENSLEEFLEAFLHFLRFITLSTFEASFPQYIYLEKENVKVKVYYQHAYLIKPSGKTTFRDFLFTYDDICSNFSTVIGKWYSNKETIEPVLNLLINSFYNTGRFTESDFLHIIHALETFHRRFRRNEALLPKEHKKRIKEIVNTVNPKYKKWLQEKLNFANEPTLHNRLEELIDEFSNKTTRKIIRDKQAFIKDVKNSRNYYTHYDKRLERKVKRGNELFLLTEKLRVVLVCAVLKENGIKEEQIEEFLGRNEWRHFNHIIS